MVNGADMNIPLVRRALATFSISLGVFHAGLAAAPSVEGGTRHPDPAQIVPLEKIALAHREAVSEVIASHTLHRQGAVDTFPCNPQLYLSLLNEPLLTLALWKDLSTSPAQLQQIGPDRYQGTDGAGTTASWEYVYRSPKLHVLLCNLDYQGGPRGNARLEGRIVLIVRTEYFRKAASEHWIRHDIEAFVKVDSKGWRTVARTIRPLIEKVLEDQVQEAGWFISLMGRLVELYPTWACQVAQQVPQLRPEAREGFRALVLQNKRPGASTGRPVLAENPNPSVRTR
jgi:hypothetical protein